MQYTVQPTQTPPQAAGQQPPPEASQPLVEKYQNYWMLRNTISTQFTLLAPEYMSKIDSFDYRQDQAEKAGHLIAQRTTKFLPQQTITQENLSEAISRAIGELTDNEPWFDAALPGGRKRKSLARAIAKTVDVKISQAALSETKQRSQEILANIPDQEEVAQKIQKNLQTSGLTPEQSQKVAGQFLTDVEQKSLQHGASPSSKQTQLFLDRSIRDNTKGLERKQSVVIARQVSQASKPELSARSEALAHNRRSIVEKVQKDPGFAKTLFKHVRQLERFQKIDKTLSSISVVTSPIATVQKTVSKGVARVSLKTLKWMLVKAGLGSMVRYAEEVAISVGTAGLGIPIAVAQEIVARGIGNLTGTAKKVFKDWKTAIQTGFQNPLQGSIKVLQSTTDTIGATVGGGIGGLVGMATGAFVGGIIGSAVPIVGTIIGGLLGGLFGGLAGAGFGAKKGYDFRRKLEKKLKLWLIFKLAGLSPLKILLALAKALLIYPVVNFIVGLVKTVGVKALSFIQTGLARAITGAQNLLRLVFYTPKFIAVQASSYFQAFTSGQSLLAQSLRGIGNLLQNIPSALARGFNTLTGELSRGLFNLAAKTESILGNILTQGVSPALAAMPVATIATVGLLGAATYTVLITAFYVHPTDVTPYIATGIGGVGGLAGKCPEGGQEITADLAARMTNGVVNLLPNTVSARNDATRLCITPTAIVMHWSGGWDNDSGNDATYNYLITIDRACQVATDTNDVFLMQPFYETEVEMAWCANSFNAFSVSNEMAGGCTHCPDDRRFTNPPPPPNHPESDLAVKATCEIMKQYNIPWCQIYGHYQVPDSGGKEDPGKEFLEGYFIPRIRSECPNDTLKICP